MTESINQRVRPKPVILCILDGWGYREQEDYNAIAQALTPHWDRFIATYPYTTLQTSGKDVGLPVGQMGNSEVGHMNIGSGRIVMQSLPRIDDTIAKQELENDAVLQGFIDTLKQTGGRCHLMGLISDGGVHAHINHMVELARIISGAGVPVDVHAFTDGRDVPPQSAAGYMGQLEGELINFPGVNIRSVTGRYYAMDRDKRWERIQRVYDALVKGEGLKAKTPEAAIEESYIRDEVDEFVQPTIIGDYEGMRDKDALLMANFRADRARQILTALLDPTFDGFSRAKKVDFVTALGMVEYSDEHSQFMQTLFSIEPLDHILGQVLEVAGLKQLRIAETEKYAHVTFFFNGGKEQTFPGEDRILVPSPKVATYDLQPEMSASEVTDKLVEAIEADNYDFIVVNYANTDMVGHTGDMEAAKKAVEAVDTALGRLEKAVLEKNGVLLITADHGNAEQMIDPDAAGPHTAHTLNPVPLIAIGIDRNVVLTPGRLCDLAPTILGLMNLDIPDEMTGKMLIT